MANSFGSYPYDATYCVSGPDTSAFSGHIRDALSSGLLGAARYDYEADTTNLWRIDVRYFCNAGLSISLKHNSYRVEYLAVALLLLNLVVYAGWTSQRSRCILL
ncbi:unnamed protein product [Albugo candida]|uniref:Uncharacterized protein n=1 Tax=Albugo candida TaxID=65357 RepID=A0A024G5I9_9STRA|nr:unnamed protein product [Albugo candida]|eukprot:CCI41818.1 unnamed protein product [Albugo candida]